MIVMKSNNFTLEWMGTEPLIKKPPSGSMVNYYLFKTNKQKINAENMWQIYYTKNNQANLKKNVIKNLQNLKNSIYKWTSM